MCSFPKSPPLGQGPKSMPVVVVLSNCGGDVSPGGEGASALGQDLTWFRKRVLLRRGDTIPQSMSGYSDFF